MTELKNCPFCGSEPELGLHGPLVDGEPRIAIWCVSGKCPMDDVGGNNFDTEEAAIKAWNTRVDRWNPVADGFPEEGEWVLVWNGSYIIVGEIAGNRTFYDNCDGLAINGVTHWRILPAPPEEEG